MGILIPSSNHAPPIPYPDTFNCQRASCRLIHVLHGRLLGQIDVLANNNSQNTQNNSFAYKKPLAGRQWPIARIVMIELRYLSQLRRSRPISSPISLHSKFSALRSFCDQLVLSLLYLLPFWTQQNSMSYPTCVVEAKHSIPIILLVSKQI